MNKVFNLFFVVLLGLLGREVIAMDRAASLDLAILYNDNIESVFSFVPYFVSDPITLNIFGGLLEAQQAPILVSGDIALHLALCVTEPSVAADVQEKFKDYAKFIAEIQKIDVTKEVMNREEIINDIAGKIIELDQHCEKLRHKIATEKSVDDITLRSFFAMRWYMRELQICYAMIHSKPIKLNIFSLAELLGPFKKNPFKVICDACSFCHKTKVGDCISSTGVNVKDLAINFCVNLAQDWCLYVSSTPEHFVLFVPVAYARAHAAYDELAKTVDLAKLGFDPKVFKTVSADELAICSAGYTFDADKIAAAISSIFSAPVTGHVWNIFIAGHGLPTNQICGMPTGEFLKLVDLFSHKIPTKFLVYGTCYGGGDSAVAIEKHVSATLSHPTVISLSGAKSVILIMPANGTADYGMFFQKLDELSLNAVYDPKLLVDVCGCTKWCDGFKPLILLPEEKKFNEIAEPDFIIFNDAAGNSHVRGAKATAEYCSESADGIKFNATVDEACILLETDNVKKRLTFEASKLNFATKSSGSQRITFEEIKINHGFGLICQAFVGKGVRRFTIKKCLISNEKDWFYSTVLEKILPVGPSEFMLKNIEVIDYFGSTVEILFEYKEKLYVYRLGKERGWFFAINVALPPAEEDKELLRNALIKHLEAGTALAKVFERIVGKEKEIIEEVLAYYSRNPFNPLAEKNLDWATMQTIEQLSLEILAILPKLSVLTNNVLSIIEVLTVGLKKNMGCTIVAQILALPAAKNPYTFVDFLKEAIKVGMMEALVEVPSAARIQKYCSKCFAIMGEDPAPEQLEKLLYQEIAEESAAMCVVLHQALESAPDAIELLVASPLFRRILPADCEKLIARAKELALAPGIIEQLTTLLPNK